MSETKEFNFSVEDRIRLARITAYDSEKDDAPMYLPLKDKQRLQELEGYIIEGISESTGSSKGRSTEIFLKRELPDGSIANRVLMIDCNGNKYITNEY